MSITIELNKKVTCPVSRLFFSGLAQETYHRNKLLSFLKKKNLNVSIAIIGKKEMQKLNKTWRGIDQPTDVLSFAEYSWGKLKKVKEKDIFLGEMILCFSDISAYAKKTKRSVRQELAEVAIHGFLHLTGLDHGEKMFQLQKETLTRLLK